MNENYDELASLIVHGLDMEKKIASGNIRRLNAAMKSGCQDINLLDSLADPLFDTMLGLSGRGERTYLRFLKYQYPHEHLYLPLKMNGKKSKKPFIC